MAAALVSGAAADTLNGEAALATLRALCEGKNLKLLSSGDSAEREFVVTVYSRDSSAITQIVSVDGRGLVVLRTGPDHLPAGLGGQD